MARTGVRAPLGGGANGSPPLRLVPSFQEQTRRVAQVRLALITLRDMVRLPGLCVSYIATGAPRPLTGPPGSGRGQLDETADLYGPSCSSAAVLGRLLHASQGSHAPRHLVNRTVL